MRFLEPSPTYMHSFLMRSNTISPPERHHFGRERARQVSFHSKLYRCNLRDISLIYFEEFHKITCHLSCVARIAVSFPFFPFFRESHFPVFRAKSVATATQPQTTPKKAITSASSDYQEHDLYLKSWFFLVKF